jgi:sec1 family domain-containing protein 1
VTRIDRPLMENMAHGLVTNNAAGFVSKVYDQYLDMISLEPTLFTLNIPDSFVAYNRPSLEETQIRAFISRLVVGLLSMVRVLGALPVIRAASGGPAEMLAHELNTSLREALNPRGASHSNFSDFVVSDRPRPLLVIFDRTSDLATPLTHSCTYQSLVDDLLDHRLNKVTVNVSGKDAVMKKKTYDLNTKIDLFFAQYSGAPFPEAVEANEVELASVSQREKEIRSRPSGTQEGADLNDAITSLPEILAKKANLEAHTNILQGVMREVAARDVPTFFEIEQSILQSGGSIDKPAVLELLRDGSKGTIVDKTRLLAIVLLSQDKLAKALEEEFSAAFIAGCQSGSDDKPASSEEEIASALQSVSFLLKLHKLQGPMAGMSAAGGGGGDSAISSLFSTATNMASSTMAKAAALFSKFAPVHVTRVVDSLAEGKACAENDSYLCLDPKAKAHEVSDLRSQQYGEAIVFMIGGGCYTEYFNLQELVHQTKTSQSQKSLRNVLYGGSEMLTCQNFLSQLNTLGKSQ